MATDLPACFENHRNNVGLATISEPCGIPNSTHPYVTCCVHGDYCLADGICKYTHSQIGGSGYYLGDCTDSTFSDASCPKACNSDPYADVIYNSTTDQWHCCSYAGLTSICSQPGDEHFNAPAPSNLATIQYLPLAAFPTYSAAAASSATSDSSRTQSSSASSSSSQSSTSSASPSTSSSSSHSHGLSGGAAAGIGIGVAAVIIFIAILAALVIRQRRRRRREMGGDGSYPSYAHSQPPVEMPGEGTTELEAKRGNTELDAKYSMPNRDAAAELEAHG